MIFVGLGNPDQGYQNTRHNLGSLIVRSLKDRLDPSAVWRASPKLKSSLAKIDRLILAIPTVYMNESGTAVARIKNYYKKELLIIHDDAEIELGEIRVKFGGTSGGHNGVRSIDEQIGPDYWRFRVGVGRNRSIELADYLLSPFSDQELAPLAKIVDRSVDQLVEYTLQALKTEKIKING